MKYIKILAVCFLLSVVFLYFDSDVSAMRNLNHETMVQLKEGGVIKQKVKLSHTPYVSVDVDPHIESEKQNLENCGVEVTVQGEETGEIVRGFFPLSDFEDSVWGSLRLENPLLADIKGTAEITVRSVGLTETDCFYLLVVENPVSYQTLIDDRVEVNGSTWEGQYINLNYRYYGIAGVLKFFFIALTAVSLLYMTRKTLFSLLRNHTVIVVAAALLLWKLTAGFIHQDENNPWCYEIYFMTWKYGFVAQAFLGTVIALFDWFFTEQDYKTLMILFLLTAFVLQIFFLRFTGKENTRKDLERFALIYVVSPCFLTTFCDNPGMFGKPDVPVLICFLLCCMAIVKQYYALVPIAALIGVLMHPQFVFEYFPMLMILMLYESFVAKKRACLKWLLLTLGICSVTGFYIQFIGKVSVPLEVLVSEIQKRTDLEITGGTYLWEYYKGMPTVLKDVRESTLYSESLHYLIYAAFLSLPLLLYLGEIFKYVLRNCRSRLEKLLMILIPASGGLVLITMIVAVDWGRYVLAYFNAVFFLVFTFIRMENPTITNGIIHANKRMEQRFGSHWLPFMVICSAVCGIGEYGAGSFYDKINPIFNAAFRNLANIIN